jgi:hypothetical protein
VVVALHRCRMACVPWFWMRTGRLLTTTFYLPLDTLSATHEANHSPDVNSRRRNRRPKEAFLMKLVGYMCEGAQRWSLNYGAQAYLRLGSHLTSPKQGCNIAGRDIRRGCGAWAGPTYVTKNRFPLCASHETQTISIAPGREITVGDEGCFFGLGQLAGTLTKIRGSIGIAKQIICSANAEKHSLLQDCPSVHKR